MSSDLHEDPDELDADEPRTPMWLPLLGAALFLVALMVFLVTRSDEEQDPNADAAAAQPDTGAAQPEVAEPDPAQPSAAQPGTDRPGAGEAQADAHQRMPGDPHFGHDHP